MMRSGWILSIPIMSPRFRQVPDVSSIPNRLSGLAIQHGETLPRAGSSMDSLLHNKAALFCMMAGPEIGV